MNNDEISHVISVSNEGVEELLEVAMQYVKRMGTGRTRGYGRCKISIREEG